jgi:hypothetical protein
MAESISKKFRWIKIHCNGNTGPIYISRQAFYTDYVQYNAGQTNQLLSSIRDTIKSYVVGEISFAQAGEACQELEKTCAEIEKTEEPRRRPHFSQEFFHHNVENFAKLTVLFRKDDMVSLLKRSRKPRAVRHSRKDLGRKLPG